MKHTDQRNNRENKHDLFQKPELYSPEIQKKQIFLVDSIDKANMQRYPEA